MDDWCSFLCKVNLCSGVFSDGWNILDGSQHIVRFCYKQKKLDNYLICYILAGYAGLVIPMREILEADPNPANGILLMLYTAVFWGVAVVTRVISGIFYSVLNRFGSSK